MSEMAEGRRRDLRPRCRENWLSQAEACRTIGCNARHVQRLEQLGLISTRQLPGGVGCKRYSRADCEKIARESVRPVRAEAPPQATAS